MSRRYAFISQNVLYRDGKLVGINVGWGPYSEHDLPYLGTEQESIIEKKESLFNYQFDGEIIVNPELVKLIELCDENVLITNDMEQYERLNKLTNDERDAEIKKMKMGDKIRAVDAMSSLKESPDIPEIEAFWESGFTKSGGSFNLVSTSRQSSELLRKLFKEIQRKNVAISSDFSFLFGDIGLSFVLLDQLTEEDIEKKRIQNNTKSIKNIAEKERIETVRDAKNILEGISKATKQEEIDKGE